MGKKLRVALVGIALVVLGIFLSVPFIMKYFGTMLKGFDAKYGALNMFLTVLGLVLVFFGLFIISAGLKRFAFLLTVCGIFIFILLVGGVYSYKGTIAQNNGQVDQAKVVIPTGSGINVEIPMNSNTTQIADILKKQDIIKNPKVFKLLSKMNGYDGKYQAGIHIVSKGLDLNTLMIILTGKPESIQITIPEGLTYREIANLFVKKDLTTQDQFDRAMKYEKYDYDFVNQITNVNNREFALEGYLFPDTYEFAKNVTSKSIVEMMLSNFNKKIQPEYYKRAKELGMSMDQIITLASIIEREANSTKERQMVSAVFHKRLKSNDPTINKLQSCATIQYIYLNKEGKVKPILSYQDTQIDDPYNTYIHRGLPPGPICSPGLDAIKAALYPDEDCDYMFFIAKGDGTTKFSKTFAEHQKAMKEYGLAK